MASAGGSFTALRTRSERAQHPRHHRHQQRQRHDAAMKFVVKDRESKTWRTSASGPCQPGADGVAGADAHDDNDQHQLEVVQADFEMTVAEGIQGRFARAGW